MCVSEDSYTAVPLLYIAMICFVGIGINSHDLRFLRAFGYLTLFLALCPFVLLLPETIRPHALYVMMWEGVQLAGAWALYNVRRPFGERILGQ